MNKEELLRMRLEIISKITQLTDEAVESVHAYLFPKDREGKLQAFWDFTDEVGSKKIQVIKAVYRNPDFGTPDLAEAKALVEAWMRKTNRL